MTTPARDRHLDAWGFTDTHFAVPAGTLAWLAGQLGPPLAALGRLDLGTAHALAAPLPAAALPDLGCASSTTPIDRLSRARGQGLADLIRLRSGTVPALPDAIARPRDRAELRHLLAVASRHGLRLIPRGGGTSVTGAVNVPADGRPTVVIDLTTGFCGLRGLDPTSQLATFGAGTDGPAVEAALAPHGLTLGHFPQSFELSTVGGWIAARASGQESLGVGSVADLLAGLTVDTPVGPLDLAAQPASAAGPDLRQLVLGSEGRTGVIAEATLRVHAIPEVFEVVAYLLPSYDAGTTAARMLLQQGVGLQLLRLSDEAETAVALTVGLGGRPLAAKLLAGWLRLRRFPLGPAAAGHGARGCLMLIGAAGSLLEVERTFDQVDALLAEHRAVRLGRGPGANWKRDRFRHPYLRDALLSHGYASETVETAAPWSRVPAVARGVRDALANALAKEGEQVAVLCHISHPYPDGASLYFTFFYRLPAAASIADDAGRGNSKVDVERAIERWAALKRAATDAIASHGATLTHHHGVGSWHAPWYRGEVGTAGLAALGGAVSALDPAGVLNPQTLLDPTDRLRD